MNALRRLAVPVALLALVLPLACSSPSESCTWRESTQRVFYGHEFETAQRATVSAMTEAGWDCEMTLLLDLQGEAYGERHDCRICD